MSKINKRNLTRIFKGFRPGVRPVYKINLQYLERLKVLTSLQHNIVKDKLNKCAYTKEITKVIPGKEDKIENKLVITLDPWHIARLVAILDKSYNSATVNNLGDPWEAPKELTEKEIEVMRKEKGRKGKARKELKKEE